VEKFFSETRGRGFREKRNAEWDLLTSKASFKNHEVDNFRPNTKGSYGFCKSRKE